ncbi:GntR family transcriptional regulator [Pseudonocardia sp. H11422]|uniref:GntR family transcriptional regulator n=1 Tax=Pseudonocardia sp. H11422 TaxID=2835866 RepID=UPI0027E2C487|nr:GntR family transcriptional regulator [Pseudonocardia sp. H11422]
MNAIRYLDIAEELAAELHGRQPGARVPGEHDITRRFGVGRAAARAALQELERRLLVRRVQGAGTFVNRRIDYVISQHRRPSWHRTVTAAGARPRSVVRGVDRAELPADRAELLGMPPGSPAHLLVRQSYIDDLLASWSNEWVPVDLVPELRPALHAVDSLDVVLRQMARVCPVRSWSRVSLDVPPADVLAGLQMEATQPVWLVESVSRDAETGRPLMCSSSWMRADALRVVVELGSRTDPPPTSGQRPASQEEYP